VKRNGLTGLLAGDFETAQDLEFIIANKITRIINCAGREIANAWERSGIRYLTFFWPEAGNCVIFDDSNSVLDDLYAFVEEALDVGESVLVHSTDGQSRACFCSAVYFMLKYKWCVLHAHPWREPPQSQGTRTLCTRFPPPRRLLHRPTRCRTLQKTMEFLQNKRPDLMPRPGFMRQLQALDASLQRVIKAGAKGAHDASMRRYSDWDPTVIGAYAPWPGPVPPALRPPRVAALAFTLSRPLPSPFPDRGRAPCSPRGVRADHGPQPGGGGGAGEHVCEQPERPRGGDTRCPERHPAAS